MRIDIIFNQKHNQKAYVSNIAYMYQPLCISNDVIKTVYIPAFVVCHRRLGLNNWGKQANGKFNIEITIRKCPACNLSASACVNYKQCKAHVYFGV